MYIYIYCIVYVLFNVCFSFEFSLENLIFLCEASRGNEGGLNFPNQ